jgi:hypothetical protein
MGLFNDRKERRTNRVEDRPTPGLSIKRDPTRQYRYSFSGADAKAYVYFEGMEDTIRQLEALHTISVSVHEAKGQARALGFRGIKGMARGVRTIAGSIIFTVIEDNPLRPLMDNLRDFESRVNTVWPGWSVDRHEIGVGTAFGGDLNFSNRIAPLLPPTNVLIEYQSEGAMWSPRGDISTFTVEEVLALGTSESFQQKQIARTQAASIEGSGLLLRGVEFIDEGIVTSINDVVSEVTLSFIATDFKPLSSQVFDGGAPYLPANEDQQRQRVMQQELFGKRQDQRVVEENNAINAVHSRRGIL